MIEIFQEDIVYDYIGPEILYRFTEVLQGLSHLVFGHLVFGLGGIVDLIAHQCGCCINGLQNGNNRCQIRQVRAVRWCIFG